jgi:hypothetical protein
MTKRTEISIAIIGVAIALITLIFGDNIYLQITGRSFGEDFRQFFSEKPTATETVNVPAPTQEIIESSNPSILFSENFEDDRAQSFDYISGDWKITEDDTGNNIYELDNTNVSGFSSVLKFGSSTWKNYEIQCRVKMLNLIGNDVPEFLVYFNYDNSASPSGYVLNLQPSSEVADLIRVNSGQWEKGVSRHYKYSPNTWYSIRITAKDSVIQVYINNALVADTDYQTKAGSIEINIGPKSKIQLDDIEVIKIGE